MDSAIRIGFLAFAIAVLIKTPSQPNSIAIEASDAVPIPASIMTGTLELFFIKEINGMNQQKSNVFQIGSKAKKKEFSENLDKKKVGKGLGKTLWVRRKRR